MNRVRIIVFLWTFLAAPWVDAATAFPTDYYKDPYYGVGVIDRVDLKGGKLVVSDVLYTLAKTAKVYSINMAETNRVRLFQGTKIGFQLATPGGREIVTIWLLPKLFEEKWGE